MKHRLAAVVALVALAACAEAPTGPTSDLILPSSFNLTASAEATTVITFDDPAGVYAPGDVEEKGFRVWESEPDGWKFGVVSWDGSDGPDLEINLGNNGRTIQIARLDGAPFTLLSFFAASLRTSTAGITVRGFDAANALVTSVVINDPAPGAQHALPASFADMSRVTLQSSGGGGQGNHILDDFTILAGVTGPETKDDCKDGGWEQYGFKNQGQCVRFIETGKDSR